MVVNSKRHWEKVYQIEKPTGVSWYQILPMVSLKLIDKTKIATTQRIIDVGGGASVLVDKLLEKGFSDVTVLEISSMAIQYAKERLRENTSLADRRKKVCWIEADVTRFKPRQQYDLWHDRAVFHFLTNAMDRKRYIRAMRRGIRPGGHVIIATFALDGPPQCSGLNIRRYDSAKLQKELGNSFKLIKSIRETHKTPWNSKQKFIYNYFRKAND